MDIKKILVVGNGFDLAHELPTRYSDFLIFINMWDTLGKSKPYEKFGSGINKTKLPKFLSQTANVYTMLESLLNPEEFNEWRYDYKNLIENNCFVKFFISSFKINNGSEKWIDLESEIQQLIHFLQDVAYNELNGQEFNLKWTKYPQHLPKCLNTYVVNKMRTSENYVIRDKYELLKMDEIWKELKIELNQVRIALYRYLLLIDRTKTPNKKDVLDTIIDDQTYIINFNYTSTCEKVYKIDKNKIHYIHGHISSNQSDNKYGIVLGMPDSDKKTDTVYFKKYFQRIQYKTGTKYKSWLSLGHEHKIEVIFYGHSMDENDKDLIYTIIKNTNTEKTTIYFVNQNDYENKIINLIKILGKDDFEEMYYDGKILFKHINEKYDENESWKDLF